MAIVELLISVIALAFSVVPMVLLVGLVVLVIVMSGKGGSRKKAWKSAAHELGLKMKDGWLDGLKMHGDIRGCSVRVEKVKKGKNNYETRYQVYHPKISRSLNIEPEGIGTGLRKMFGATDISIDGGRFDDKALLQGDERQMVALMNWRNRKGLERLVDNGGKVSASTIENHVDGVASSQKELLKTVRALVDLALQLRQPEDEVDALASNAVQDRDPDVRLRNLLLLLEHHERRDRTARVTRKLCTDHNDSVRLLALAHQHRWDSAAQALGGVQEIPDPVLYRVIKAAAQSMESEPTAVMRTVAVEPKAGIQSRVFAIQQLLERDDSQLMRSLSGLLADKHPAVVRGTIAGMTKRPNPAFEPLFVRLLNHKKASVQVAAIDAVADIGTIAAVEPLLPLTEGFFADGKVKAAARGAIAAIQERAGGGTQGGQVSVAAMGEVEGRVSPVELDREGAVSEHPGTRGRTSRLREG